MYSEESSLGFNRIQISFKCSFGLPYRGGQIGASSSLTYPHTLHFRRIIFLLSQFSNFHIATRSGSGDIHKQDSFWVPPSLHGHSRSFCISI